MKLKFAIAGLRHGHITALNEKVKKHPDCQLVAACEEDADAGKKHVKTGRSKLLMTLSSK